MEQKSEDFRPGSAEVGSVRPSTPLQDRCFFVHCHSSECTCGLSRCPCMECIVEGREVKGQRAVLATRRMGTRADQGQMLG